jgi:hypothetical protein
MMPKLNPQILIPLLEQAHQREIGIAIETNDPKALRAELYKARDESGREEFHELITFLPEGKNEVFICHKSAELPE